ncbi:hypothetical protein E4U23_007548 [Claviceps purpurea]|nr:hypothetical protein E4U51_007467 [Claviceps purpurea]KAG6177324.1 hypothetical protein E4U36_007372 [Claviceps purpurea]KAG6253569.1 hypothetical protein E4U23_007548 [Claviceps purpurea]
MYLPRCTVCGEPAGDRWLGIVILIGSDPVVVDGDPPRSEGSNWRPTIAASCQLPAKHHPHQLEAGQPHLPSASTTPDSTHNHPASYVTSSVSASNELTRQTSPPFHPAERPSFSALAIIPDGPALSPPRSHNFGNSRRYELWLTA